jgi:hypothetical protein
VDGGEAPERGPDVLRATGLETEHTPRGAVLAGRPCGLVHAEEVEVCHEAIVVAISDVCAEHVSILGRAKHSAQAMITEHSFGQAV